MTSEHISDDKLFFFTVIPILKHALLFFLSKAQCEYTKLGYQLCY